MNELIIAIVAFFGVLIGIILILMFAIWIGQGNNESGGNDDIVNF